MGKRYQHLGEFSDLVEAALRQQPLFSQDAELLDHSMTHTWMFFPSNWSRYGDWPDLAACRAPSPLLVQYDLDDHLLPGQECKPPINA